MYGSPARVWLGPEMFPGIGVPPGPATEPHIVKGGPQWPQGEFRVVSPVPPGPGWNKQRTEIPRPSSPAGTAAAECPEGAEPPACHGGRPLQPRFPKEHHHRRAADDSLCGTRPQSKHRLQPGNGEGRRGGRGGSWPPPQRCRPAPDAFDHRAKLFRGPAAINNNIRTSLTTLIQFRV